MSTPADIRSAWLANIWSDASITALTDKIYQYDVTQQSDAESAKFYDTGGANQQEINFITALTLRRPVEFELGGKERVQFEHQVDVNYYLRADVAGLNYNAVIDRLVTIESLVITALGQTWQGTVDLYRLTDVFAPTEITLDGRQVWQGRNIYTATERTQYT